MSLKKYFPPVRFNGEKVQPDEIDRYEVYPVIFPSVSTSWFGNFGTSGTADVVALAVTNKLADYPRNIALYHAGSAAGMTGTAVVNGKDQFGHTIQESLTYAGASNGGTVKGTKVFAEVTSGTFSYGTAAGVGTPVLGVDTTGTTCLFGLPTKIASTADVKTIACGSTGVAQSVNGGTIGAFVSTAMHAVKAPVSLTGTAALVVQYKTTYNAENETLAGR